MRLEAVGAACWATHDRTCVLLNPLVDQELRPQIHLSPQPDSFALGFGQSGEFLPLIFTLPTAVFRIGCIVRNHFLTFFCSITEIELSAGSDMSRIFLRPILITTRQAFRNTFRMAFIVRYARIREGESVSRAS